MIALPIHSGAQPAFYVILEGEYALQPRLSLLGSLPFADKAREIAVTNASHHFDETARFSALGPGDLSVLMKCQLVSPSILPPFEVAIGGGASLPTGSFEKEQGNAQLSIDLQPGTGALVPLQLLFATQ